MKKEVSLSVVKDNAAPVPLSLSSLHWFLVMTSVPEMAARINDKRGTKLLEIVIGWIGNQLQTL